MGDLFNGYGVQAAKRRKNRTAAWDEMFADHGRSAGAQHARPAYRELYAALATLTQDELRGRTDALASSYLAQGVTFDFAGEERPFPLDAVPRVIEQAEWTRIESGVKQRVRALEAFLSDVYGAQNAVRDGVIPAGLITSSAHFHRAAAGVESANGVRIQVSGVDLIRDEFGEWRVLEDNVRVPSGVSYVISNRRVMAQTLPELFTSMRVRPVGDYPYRLLQALRASAPGGMDAPNVVVLTPGVYNSAYFEHTLLARLMGVELVEGRDLFCSAGKVWMRTTSGPRRVDVIYRRIDDEYLDPLQFRVDSVLGTPGLMLAARLGNVTIANAVGNGVADDKLVYTYLPDLIRYYLAEEPLIPNVDTWRLEDPGALEEVLDRLDELVVKPVDGSGGKGLVIGPDASKKELDRTARPADRGPARLDRAAGRAAVDHPDTRRRRHASPARRPAPVRRQRRARDLGSARRPHPGGAARGQLVVNSSQGGGSKDTWVVGVGAADTEPVEIRNVQGLVADQAAAPAAAVRPSIRRTTSEQDGPRNDQQQQQQQSRTDAPC